MMKNILFVCLLMSQLLALGCASKKDISADEDCQQQLKLAQQQLTDKSAELDKTLHTTISNLLTAAKIHDQHNQHALCIDKTARALSLMDKQIGTNTSQN